MAKKKKKQKKSFFKSEKAEQLFREENQDCEAEWKDIFKRYKTAWWRKDLADRVFSQYIRIMNADKNGMCKCVTCGEMFTRKEIQNGHYRSRADNKYRFSEINCHPQCVRCNVMLSGNYRNYCRYMIETYGEKMEREIREDKTTEKHNQWWYEYNILNWYRQLVKKARSFRNKDLKWY